MPRVSIELGDSMACCAPEVEMAQIWSFQHGRRWFNGTSSLRFVSWGIAMAQGAGTLASSMRLWLVQGRWLLPTIN
ncbi:carbohydrate ABC transporter permease [Sesbania bispinosa]|nr:carbohydrate ABC transporter permease [Sesbania bispinosa]